MGVLIVVVIVEVDMISTLYGYLYLKSLFMANLILSFIRYRAVRYKERRLLAQKAIYFSDRS